MARGRREPLLALLARPLISSSAPPPVALLGRPSAPPLSFAFKRWLAPPFTWSPLRLLAPWLVLAALLAACADRDVAATETPTPARTPASAEVAAPARHPNVVLILADDMGYGDIGAYNPESKIPTPHLDRLAAEGMRFTDAHTTSAVCTPTRYGIITGQYSWRGPLKRGVTWSYDTLIVDTAESTIASVLGGAGYRTACIGKWHLGLGWQRDPGGAVRFDRPLTAGPTDLGFDYFYGIAASLDIPPYVYLRDRRVVEQPTDSSAGTSPAYYDDYWRAGPVSPDFDHYETLEHLTAEAERTIRDAAGRREPFFVYFPLTAPHLPWIPRPEFRGLSRAGKYGDLAAEVDAVVGRVTALLEELGVGDNTIVIFTSDNGSQFSSESMARYGHRANGPWRGRKGDIFEGGHRVPFLVRWPGRVAAGSVSDALVSTTDFYATFAELVGAPVLPEGETKDSHSFLPSLLGATGSPPRRSMVYHSAQGLFALRDGDDVLVAGRGSGGFLEAPDTSAADLPYQLYDLAADGAQAVDRAAERPGRRAAMMEQLMRIRNADGGAGRP